MTKRKAKSGRPFVEFVFHVRVMEVEHLLEIAAAQKHRADAEIIFRAAIVFIVAVWQTYIEAVADHLANPSKLGKTRLSTPSSDNIDRHFMERFKIDHITSAWKWRGMSSVSARRKLDSLLQLRHDIAHKARTRRPVTRMAVLEYVHFVHRLAVYSHNAVERHRVGVGAATRMQLTRYDGVIGRFCA
jgi:RiboL-PSP-HEPN